MIQCVVMELTWVGKLWPRQGDACAHAGTLGERDTAREEGNV